MKKFFGVIGNPPYQDETVGNQKTFAPPIYHMFLDEAYKISDHVELIHPARFLFNAGNTPKSWNRVMLSNPHLKVIYYEQDSSKIFINTEIKGGIAITYHDKGKVFGEIGIFTAYRELNDIIRKVKSLKGFKTFSKIVVSRTAYRLTNKMHNDHPEALEQLSDGHAYDMATNIFERLPQIFFEIKPDDDYDYIQILGRINNERVYRYIRADYVNVVSNLNKYKIFLPSANGSGALGEGLSSPIMAAPKVGSTETFISIGCFDTKKECEAALRYIKSKFVRILLGVLKVTQHITPEKWLYVPLQDFTSKSDIDWSKTIHEIDQQLYAKYGLDDDEIEFIETHVEEMS